MKLKRIFALVITVVILISVVSCNSSATTTNTTEITTVSLNTSATTQSTTIVTTTTGTVATTSDKNPNEIELTLDNYSKYLSVTSVVTDAVDLSGQLYVRNLNNGNGIRYDGGYTFYLYKYFDRYTRVSGVSTNFNYNDVVVTVRYTGSYKTVNTTTNVWTDGDPINIDVTVECNITGQGSNHGKIQGNGGYMLKKMSNIKYEVIAISGTVTPA